jgi:uncharacterized protein YbjT (DUF2867 family)
VDPVLVIGATGHLGFAAVRELRSRGIPVRALLRDPAKSRRLQSTGADPVPGDLTDPASLTTACRGVSAIVATANAALPARGFDTFDAVDDRGYQNLLEAARAAAVPRIVYTSVIPVRGPVPPLFQRKYRTAERIAASGLDHVIFQPPAFMDIAFAMMGSDIPIRGAEWPSVTRPFPMARDFFESVRRSIEDKHVALVPGKGDVRHSFICVADVARYLAAAATGGPAGVHTIAGPEALTYLDVVRLYERLLGYPIAAKFTPALVFRVLSFVLRFHNPAAANLMAINHLAATEPSVLDPAPAARAFGVTPTSAEDFLREKLNLPRDSSWD